MPTLLLTALLGLFPFLFLFPDVLSVGDTFIRGDYLLLPFGALLLLHRFAFTERTLPFAGYSGGALAIMIGFPLLTLFQFLWIPEHIIDMEGAVKYALWPLKMVVWAVCMRELFVAHPNPLKAVYQVFATLVVLVFSLQVVELVSVPARLQILETFAAIRQARPSTALIMVSHDLGIVQHIADRILVLHDGHVVEAGSTASILGDPKSEYTVRLIEAASL